MKRQQRREKENCKVKSFTLMMVFTDKCYSQHDNPIYMYIVLKKKCKVQCFQVSADDKQKREREKKICMRNKAQQKKKVMILIQS